jgi:formylglycine-generating enzyme required for sulfatase activity/regulator of replication initiation timing
MAGVFGSGTRPARHARRLIGAAAILGVAAQAIPPATAKETTALPPSADAAWCGYDDPAWMREEDIHASDLGRTVQCPEPASAQTLPVELVLPMPCHRRMVFRKVPVLQDNILDYPVARLGMVTEPVDKAVLSTLVTAASSEAGGSAATGKEGIRQDTGLSMSMAALANQTANGAWTAPIGGGFTDPASDKAGMERVYYIGKYEVTAPQYATFAPGGAVDCDASAAAASSGPGEVPAANEISWLGAASFAEAYSLWLLKENADKIAKDGIPLLPYEQSAAGFLRLPTEAEWEFAARGGIADQATQNSLMPQTAKGIAATPDNLVNRVEVANDGRLLFLVGRKMPNLLGLYDVVGNVEEIVLDLFRPVGPGMMGGQPGGFLTRGGNSRDQDQYSSPAVGARTEKAFYTDGEVTRDTVVGFRLVLSAQFFVNDRHGESWTEGATSWIRSGQLARARLAAARMPEDVPGGARQADADRQLAELQAQVENLQTRATAAGQEIERLNADNAAYQSRIEALRDDLARRTAAGAEDPAAAAAARAQLARLQTAQEQAQMDIARLQMELQAERAASGDRAAAADAANRLQGELDRARAEARRLQTALQAQLAQLAADRDQIRQENDRLRMALADAQEVVDRRVGLDRQLTRLQADFRQAQAENAEITGNLGVARQHLAAASAEARRGARDVRQERVRSAMLTVSAINMTERMIRSAAALADRARGNLAGLPAAERATAEASLAEIARRIDILETTNSAQFRFYLGTVLSLGRGATEDVTAAVAAIRADLAAQGIVVLEQALALVERHLGVALQAGGAVPETVTRGWRDDITAVGRI